VAVPQQTQQANLSAAPLVVAAVVENSLNLVVTRNFVVAPADDALFAETSQAMALDAQRAGDDLLAHASGSAAPCVSGTLPGGANIATALASGFCQAGGWVEATGTKFNAANAYGASNTGFLAGIDRQAGIAKLGVAVGYDETSLNDKAAGKASVDTMRIGLYGALPLGGLMLTGDVIDGLATSMTTRQTGAGAARAREAGNVLGGAMQLAMPISFHGISLVPAAGVRFADVRMGGFSETAADPAFAVTAPASGGFSAQPFLRMAVSESFVTASQVVFTPAASLGVTYQTGAGGNARVESRDGTGFATRAAALDGVAGEAMVGMTASRGDLSLSATYSAQVAGNWSSQSVQAALEVKF
jgi:outer membrane autotransporter protein